MDNKVHMNGWTQFIVCDKNFAIFCFDILKSLQS